MKILVIDNDSNTLDTVKLTFELGWPEAKVIAADTGDKGLDLIEKESPNAVILALRLPGINGFEVLKQIRLFSDVPILILTVNTGEQDVVKALTWGANDYLTDLPPLVVPLFKLVQRSSRPLEPGVCNPVRCAVVFDCIPSSTVQSIPLPRSG
jgi:two-component system KDP operon response regulator KdpE/two-component system response regulator VicR